MNPKDFFTKADCKLIEKAIELAEKECSGEIRVHVDSHSTSDVLETAVDTFYKLGMTETVNRNGVLFYILCDDRRFAVIGDEGINNVVPEGFWDDVCSILSDYFKKEKFAEGLEYAIGLCGEKLKEYFPPDPDDKNELPNEVSFGEDKN